jgi:hypothetical protein
MNRRRILAWLGLAPIAAIPAVKAIASEETLGSWLRRTQCVMRDADANEIALGEFATEMKPYAGQLMQFMLTRRADGIWPTCAMIFDGARWIDVHTDEGRALMGQRQGTSSG